MSGWNKWGVRRKLFSAIVLILALNVVLLLFAGSYLFERFYTSNKISELKNSVQEIGALYGEDADSFYDRLSELENRNVIVSLFSIDENGTIASLYHSRAGKGEGSPWEKQSADWQERQAEAERVFNEMLLERAQALGDGLDARVESGEPNQPPPAKMKSSAEEERTATTSESASGAFAATSGTQQATPDEKQPGNTDRDWGRNGHDGAELSVMTRLYDETYLYVQTPKGYIKSTADLAVQYTAVLSIAILLLGSVLIYILSGRLTRPLSEMQQIADRIAHLDFSRKCVVRGEDEIAKLGESINNMSERLEASIEKLVAANETLQNDLIRQQKTDRMRRQFVANVSHDFKTPLTLMISYAEALRDTAPDSQEYCDTIIGEGNRLSRMVGRLLELSKLENGIDEVERSIFCLDEIIDGVIKNQRLLTEQRKITVRRELDSELIVEADFQKMERVVVNLYENAVKYVSDGGEIIVCARCQEEKCRLSVENTGENISLEDTENLFESFYRVDRSRGDGQSYGIGLAVVRAVMEAHQEDYGFENTDRGVRFWIDVPLAQLAENEQEEE